MDDAHSELVGLIRRGLVVAGAKAVPATDMEASLDNAVIQAECLLTHQNFGLTASLARDGLLWKRSWVKDKKLFVGESDRLTIARRNVAVDALKFLLDGEEASEEVASAVDVAISAVDAYKKKGKSKGVVGKPETV